MMFKRNLKVKNLLFIDIETTGLDVEKHEIVEIAGILVEGRTLKVLKKYNAKIKPNHLETADPKALKLINFSINGWKNAVSLEKALKEIIKMAPDVLITGWKVDFDWNFLNKNFKNLAIKNPFDYHIIDVVVLAYAYFWQGNIPIDLDIAVVAEKLGIKTGQIHTAKEDVRLAYEIFKKLMLGKK